MDVRCDCAWIERSVDAHAGSVIETERELYIGLLLFHVVEVRDIVSECLPSMVAALSCKGQTRSSS